MSHPDDLIAVLDANVSYPQRLRDVILTLAAMGYYEPRWSSQIIDEMRRNVLTDHPSIAPRRFDETSIASWVACPASQGPVSLLPCWSA